MADLRTGLQPDRLPGAEAHLNLAHPLRRFDVPAGITPRQAGVLLLLYPTPEGQVRFPLIQRTSFNEADRHRGQIGLPGGRLEPDDPSLEHTALREAEEEVGVRAGEVQVLGRLTTLYIPVSNYLVQPVVGYTTRRPHWQLQESEVERLIEAPLEQLFAHDAVGYHDVPFGRDLRLRRVPHLRLEGEQVWGATAMMLSEFRSVVRPLL